MAIYLHEMIRVVAGREEEYMASVLSLGSLPGRKRAGGHAEQVGLFRAAEHSGAAPLVVNLWEHGGWGSLAAALSRQFEDAERDEAMERWWRANTDLRRGGEDRVLLPTCYTRDRAALARDGVRGRVFLHEIARTALGGVDAYLERLGETLLPAAPRLGWQLVGAYRVAWRPREAVSLWAIEDWPRLGELLSARSSDPRLREWFEYRERVVEEVEEALLLPGRMNPLRDPSG